jgi:hypothetical protein
LWKNKNVIVFAGLWRTLTAVFDLCSRQHKTGEELHVLIIQDCCFPRVKKELKLKVTLKRLMCILSVPCRPATSTYKP